MNNPGYIVSRFVALSLITLGQVFLFGIIFHLVFVVMPNFIFETEMPVVSMIVLFVKFILILWLVSTASVATAMFISFFIKSASAANAILPFLVILQILFGGSRIQPLMIMDETVYRTSQVMTSRWGFEASALLFEFNLKHSVGDTWIINTDNKLIQFIDYEKELKCDYLTPEQCEKLKFNCEAYWDGKTKYDECEKCKECETDKERIEALLTSPQLKKIRDDKNKIRGLLKTGTVPDDSEMWKWVVAREPKAELFRPSHTPLTLFMLAIITVFMMLMLEISFKYYGSVAKSSGKAAATIIFFVIAFSAIVICAYVLDGIL